MVALSFCINVTSNFVLHINTPDSRISAVVFNNQIGPILIICVYMPVDYGDSDCMESYIATCSATDSLISDVDAVHVMVADD